MSEHPWIKTYPPGTRWNAPLRTLALPQMLDGAAARWPARCALHFEGRSFSYAELADCRTAWPRDCFAWG